jgi:hypothetical protein
MIDPKLFEQNLFVSMQAVAREHCLTTDNRNFLWSRVANNVVGVEGIHPRVGRLETPWASANLFLVPDLEQQFTKSLKHIIDQRAIEIFNYAKLKNKKIVIMWSGGIDSTCLLSAFIKNLSRADLSIIVVCTTINGIEENPYFYETQIRNRFEMLHLHDLDVSNDFLDHNLLLHGDPGDCIMGPSISKYAFLLNANQHQLAWTTNRSILYHIYSDLHAPTFAGWWVDKICENLSDLQNQGKFLNIKTISDWHWWSYFNLKWKSGTTRALSFGKKNIKEKISRSNLNDYFNFCFYGNDDFQIWSYQNLDNLVTSDRRQHKKLFKDYIYELDNNSTYLEQKLKVASTLGTSRPFVIDLDGVHHNYSDPGMAGLVKNLFNC